MEGNYHKCFMCYQEAKNMKDLVSSKFVCEECLTKNESICCLDCNTSLKTSPNNTERVLTCPCQDDHTFNCVDQPFVQDETRDRFFAVPAQTRNRDRRYCSGKCYASDPNLESLFHSENVVANSATKVKKNQELNGQSTKQTGLCGKHDMEEKKFYCKTCEISICRDCVLLDHRDHDFVYNKERINTKETLQEQLSKLLKYAEEKQAVLNEKLENLDSRLDEKNKEVEEAKLKIRSGTLRLKTLISEQEDILLSCLDGHIKSVSRNVKSQKSALESALDDVNYGLEIAQEMFRKSSPKTTTKLPNGVPKNQATSNQDTTEHVKSSLGKSNGVTIETHDLESHLKKLPISQFESEADFCDDNLDGDGVEGDGTCVDDGDGDGYIRIDEEEKRNKNIATEFDTQEWKSDMKILNNAIIIDENLKVPVPKTSTFDLVMSFGEQGGRSGQFQEPVGVTVSTDGTIFVADYINDRLQLFDKNGRFIRAMSQVTTETGRKVPFLCPTGLATDKSGNIVIAERGRHRITVINPEGKIQHKFGKLGKAHGQFRDPHGVSVDKRGRIIVADTTNNRIQVFDKEGDIIFTFGNRGQHILDYPNYAIFHKGVFIVSDTDNDSVKIFDKEGQFLRTLGDNENEGESFGAPSGLAIYKEDYILVCDFNNDCVKMFSLEGEFVTKIGCEGTAPGQFSGPEAVTVTSDDKIIVTDKNNSRVQVFELHKELKGSKDD